MFTRLSNITPETISSPKLAPQMQGARMFEMATRLAKDAVGDGVKPLHLKNGVLTFACRSSAASFALRKSESVLLETLRRDHAESGIESLYFVIRPF